VSTLPIEMPFCRTGVQIVMDVNFQLDKKFRMSIVAIIRS
jgi:hypothetical protein